MGKRFSKSMTKSEEKQKSKECLDKLEKCMTDIDGELEKFDRAANEQTDEEVQRLIRISTNDPNASKTEKDKISEVIEDIKTSLQSYQKLRESELRIQKIHTEMRNVFTNYQKHNNNRGKSKNRNKKKTKQISATIQIYFQQERNLRKGVEEWQDTLRRKLDTEIVIKHVTNTSNINQEMLLIIVCTAQARLQACATEILRDIKSKENAILLFIHFTELNNVAYEDSSLVLSGNELVKDLQGIFDITIKRDYGIVHNEKNDKNIDNLCSTIKSFITG